MELPAELPSDGADRWVPRAGVTGFPRCLRADGVVLRSDAGSQSIAHGFRESMKALGIELEAIRKLRLEGNGMIES